ncbi:MAG TPA: homoserine O-succinyltransferase [Xanthobacteraceae bacterium]|nr:homoserine O-succinyltransferase [Xanthobacteraceae bacterium]
MPVLVEKFPFEDPSSKLFQSPRDVAPKNFHEDQSKYLNIGLINNMPDAAMEATARQFLKLLGAAGQGITIRLKLFSMPGIPCSQWRRQHISTHYSDFRDLWSSHLDGLIVTGTEPRASDLRDEPYWRCLSEIIDWAEENTIATVWSCLAAHAAVSHLDGIGRSPLAEKCFGLFQHTKEEDSRLLAGLPSRISTPHSRWNEIPEGALVSAGYRILSKSAEAGVDMFVKERKSLFLFFQGHPEYDTDSLAREYRRDIGRFLRGERDSYPSLPKGYFDEQTEDLLKTFRTRALSNRRDELLSEFPTEHVTVSLFNSWQSQASCTYRNWLNYVLEHKASRTTIARRLRYADKRQLTSRGGVTLGNH